MNQHNIRFPEGITGMHPFYLFVKFTGKNNFPQQGHFFTPFSRLDQELVYFQFIFFYKYT